MKRLLHFTLSLLLVGLALPAGAAPDDPLGHWLTEDKEAVIEIFDQNSALNGKIVWLKEPLDEKGQPKLDDNNPDAVKAAAPILGLMILKDFVADGNGKWSQGTIYDPDNGKTYKCTMKLKEGALHIRGYIGISLLGRTAVWSRTNPPPAKP